MLARDVQNGFLTTVCRPLEYPRSRPPDISNDGDEHPSLLDASLWDENIGVGLSLRNGKEATETLCGGGVRQEGKSKRKAWARLEQSSEVCGIDAGPCGGISLEVRNPVFFARGVSGRGSRLSAGGIDVRLIHSRVRVQFVYVRSGRKLS